MTLSKYGMSMGWAEDWVKYNLWVRSPGQEYVLLENMDDPWGGVMNTNISIRLMQAITNPDGALENLYCWVVRVYEGEHKGEYFSKAFKL